MENEILDLIAKQGKAWEEFKSTNDARLAEIEKRGAADPLTEQKLDKINAELTEIGREYKKRLDEMEKKLNRPGRGDGALPDAELKSFNTSLISLSQKNNRPNVAPFNAEQ